MSATRLARMNVMLLTRAWTVRVRFQPNCHVLDGVVEGLCRGCIQPDDDASEPAILAAHDHRLLGVEPGARGYRNIRDRQSPGRLDSLFQRGAGRTARQLARSASAQHHCKAKREAGGPGVENGLHGGARPRYGSLASNTNQSLTGRMSVSEIGRAVASQLTNFRTTAASCKGLNGLTK